MLTEEVGKYLNIIDAITDNLKYYESKTDEYEQAIDKHTEEFDNSEIISDCARNVFFARRFHDAMGEILKISKIQIAGKLSKEKNLENVLELLTDLSPKDINSKKEFLSSFIDVIENKMESAFEMHIPTYQNLLRSAKNVNLSDTQDVIKAKLNYDMLVNSICFDKIYKKEAHLSSLAILKELSDICTPNYHAKEIDGEKKKIQVDSPMYA